MGKYKSNKLAIERLFDGIDKTSRQWNGTPCWIWTGSLSRGYGQIMARGESKHPIITHILMWRHHRGDVPNGLQLDHLCRNRACCNPEHLEAVTSRINTLRGQAPCIVIHRTEVCKHGHDCAVGGWYKIKTGGRRCATCAKQRSNSRRIARKAAVLC